MTNFVSATIDGDRVFLNEDGIDVFGEGNKQVGTNDEDGSAITEPCTLVTFKSGLQLPLDQTLDEFLRDAFENAED